MSIVAGVGLVSDGPSFGKKEVRARTGLLCVVVFSSTQVLESISVLSQLQAKQVQPSARAI